MLTLSIAVLDDTPTDLRHIADMARVYCEKEETGHQVVEFDTPEAFWQAYATRPFDIAFVQSVFIDLIS